MEREPNNDEERIKREQAVKYADASMYLSGFTISAACRELAQRFINGELSLDEYLAAPVILEDGTVISKT